MEMETHSSLLSCIVSDIKNHKGSDPLLPWLQGIRKMKDGLPPPVLREKLPRFLQKCARTFESDRVYRDDDRYLRVWLQLMDFVEDPGNVLKTMEMNRIGKKRSLFYQAYALYYEKLKKFNEAEKMYHNGVNNLAQPCSDLHKSYDQFLLRLQRHKLRKPKLNGRRRPPLGSTSISTGEKTEAVAGTRPRSRPNSKKKPEFSAERAGVDSYEKPFVLTLLKKDNSPPKTAGEDTVICKFVGSASGSEEPVLENACHHGLVEPTVNLKEAMNDINHMFGKPIEFRRASRRQRERVEGHGSFSILPDDDDDSGGDAGMLSSNHGQNLTRGADHGSGFTILMDEENEFVLKEPRPSSLERSRRDGDLFEPTACTKDAMDDINKLFGMPLSF